jgi:hypothetical protein
MNHRGRPDEGRELPTYVKALVIVVGLLVGFFDYTHKAGTVLAAVFALTLPIIVYRNFWNQRRFWTAIALLALTQIPLVMIVRSWVVQLRFGGLLAFGITDCGLVILIIAWVCSGKTEKRF